MWLCTKTFVNKTQVGTLSCASLLKLTDVRKTLPCLEAKGLSSLPMGNLLSQTEGRKTPQLHFPDVILGPDWGSGLATHRR